MALIRGYDISAYQTDKAPSDGVFCFVKATEGKSYVNAKYAAQRASVLKNGDLFGPYCFARPEQSSATAQCDRFLTIAGELRPGKDIAMLDLEASQLSQNATNAWAKLFGDRLRARLPGVATIVYFGSGYAGSNTARNLADYFDFWMYPQYPNIYRAMLVHDAGTLADLRAINRSDLFTRPTYREPLSAPTTASNWPTSFSPKALPSNYKENTGWDKPDIWQFSDNHNGYDASVSWRTLAELRTASGGKAADTDADVYLIQ